MNNIPQLPKIDISPKSIEEIKNTDKKEFEKSEAYKKYCVPAKEKIKKLKRQKRKDWWKNNWIGIVTLIITAITLIITILFELLPISH